MRSLEEEENSREEIKKRWREKYNYSRIWERDEVLQEREEERGMDKERIHPCIRILTLPTLPNLLTLLIACL